MIDLRKLDQAFMGAEKPDREYKLAPKGIYWIAIDEIDWLEGEKSDRVVFRGHIMKGPERGHNLFVSFNLVETSMYYLKAFLDTIGFGHILKTSEIPSYTDDIVGTVFEAKVDHREYNGKLYETVYARRVVHPKDSDYSTDSDNDDTPF